MSSDKATLRIQRVPSATLYADLSKVSVFSEMTEDNLACLGTVELIEAEVGAEIAPPGSTCDGFYVVLEGEVEVRKEGRPGEPLHVFPQTAGESFGEMPLLKGVQSTYAMVATAASRLVRFDEESFWQLMFSCPPGACRYPRQHGAAAGVRTRSMPSTAKSSPRSAPSLRA